MQGERDQYRGWFDRLLVIVNAYETSPEGYSAELDRLRADRDRSGAFGVLASDG